MMKGFGRLRDRGLIRLQVRRACLTHAAGPQVADSFHVVPKKQYTAVDLRRLCHTTLFLSVILVTAIDGIANADNGNGIPRKPRIDGPWWQVAHNPELPEIGSGPGQVVDHCFFQAKNGRWQLWTQIRGASVGRLFYRWEGGSDIEQQNWQAKGICWRADRKHGESCGSENEEFVHAPHVFVENGTYVLYFGGGPSAAKNHCQVNVATSTDGIHFTRACDAKGASQIFRGPGWARDPMTLKVGAQYFLYYCGDEKGKGVIALRTSSQPTRGPWSEYRVVSQGGILGTHSYSQQCPFVVYLDGYYYLFKMAGSDEYRTAVYRSQDPTFFGTEDDLLVTTLKSSASEIIRVKDQFYISSLIPGYKGVRIARLRWEPQAR